MPDNTSQPAAEYEVTRISQQPVRDVLLAALLRPHRVVEVLWWRLLGKRVRARGKLTTTINGLPFALERRLAALGKSDVESVEAARMAGIEPAIGVHLHIPRTASEAEIERAMASLQRQSVAPRSIFLTHENGVCLPRTIDNDVRVLPTVFQTRIEGLSAALREAQADGADWLVPTDAFSRLPRHSLAAYAAHLVRENEGRDPALLYGDESEFARYRPRSAFWLKPQWDPRMILSQDYVSQACALAVGPALEALAQGKGDAPESLFELVLRVSDGASVHHIERIVAHTPDENWQRGGTERTAAVARVTGERGRVSPGPFATVQLRWDLPETLPTVSVVVATRDRVELLRTCVEGVLHATDYPRLDLIIADNESVEPATLSYMDEVAADPRVQVVRWPHPFNYSAINNFAASHARGEYLCLLNNDIEVIEPDWLTEMVREAVQPGVGAVGARLLYPDRSIQHAGVAIGIGNAAGHAHRGLVEGEPGYFAQALIARGASAVTAACLLVAKMEFDAVGGLDEERLAVAYNDVDLCLKLAKRGLNNIYAPAATLIHHESKSRGLDFAPEHLDRYMRELKVFQDRWNTTRVVDPWHHPLLDRSSEVFTV